MNRAFTLLSCALVATFGFTVLAGCGSSSAPPAESADHGHDDHDHEGHDHDHDDHEGHDHDDHGDDHEGHDHPAHGPNGGHMVDLSGGAHAEWAHNDDKELITVYPENADKVTKVEMKTTIEGDSTVYPFAKADDDGQTIYTLTSPELLTAIKMGDAVKTELVITTADGESTGKVAHHAH
ncbi:hypothetical protein K227x_19880 [Rubripirellula lacrimiformis]|uniref:Uncharacterized protein n=1 Tax=Rubripirellula lacrimiformis TaxID=1930273 RepID=A0A517N8Z3_9BACT|nr:hypothetical protein [Rubripirellula lacrimiformis]QDT03604.1 hypothetical protein K227x_19880 [Rubripirellula lacrimiformis]